MKSAQDYLLFLDDSPLIPTMFGDQIQKELGIPYRVTQTLFDAHKILAVSPPLCVITSMVLRDAPKGDAVDYFTNKDIPTIILTGSFNEAIRDAVLSKRAMGYYLKERQSVGPIIEHVRRLLTKSPETVLVVDDSPTALHHETRLLEKFRFATVGVESAEAALDYMAKNLPPTMVITDYHMPGKSGVELVSTLRKNHSKDDMAIVGISASGSSMLSVEFLKAGASDFLHKPFLDEEFECRVLQNMESVINLRRLRELAHNDVLTGLFNRQYFYDVAQKQLAAGPCYAIMLDLDHFKRVNDTWGHAAGDAALRHAAQLLREFFNGPKTHLARIGGEEFAVILPKSDPDAVLRQVEEFRMRLEATPVVCPGMEPISVTVSIGLCVTSASSLDAMMQNADHYLYQAKKAGRNQTVSDHWVM
jgi:diguanylate cyclase (GGDEF)-like protein